MQPEVVPVPIGPRYRSAAERDNGIRENQSIEALARLRPVFDRKYGTVTAGNSSQITDGAAAVLLASERATFGQPEIRLGFFAPVGIVELPPLVGRAKAVEITCSLPKLPSPSVFSYQAILSSPQEAERTSRSPSPSKSVAKTELGLSTAVVITCRGPKSTLISLSRFSYQATLLSA